MSRRIVFLSICFTLQLIYGFAFQHRIRQTMPIVKNRLKLTTMSTTAPAVELMKIGDEIVIPKPENGVTRIIMKFGGSSLATAERVVYVTKLIKKHYEQGYKPVIVCSAMGKTTNTLLSAGDFALTGQIYVDSLRTLHLSVANTLALPNSTITQLNELLDDLERLLEGVKYIGELSPRTKDTLVSFGERMSVRIVSATLNKVCVFHADRLY